MTQFVFASILLAISSTIFASNTPASSDVIESAMASVVSITVLPEDNNDAHMSLGSGFIYDTHGHIITNAHVLHHAHKVIVSLQNNQSCFAYVVGSDEESDIAVLHVDSDCHIIPSKIGSSNHLKIGQSVIAIGNPHDLGQSITKGIISALHRNDLFLAQHSDSIQIDAVINPGNSGGPLVDENGHVIGINNSLLLSYDVGHTGIGFAIPISTAKPIIDQLIKTGHVVRGFIGVQTQEITKTLAKYMQFDGVGMLVSKVIPKGSADLAGIKANDVILEINGTPIVSVAQIPIIVSSYPPKTKINIKIWRRGKVLNRRVVSGTQDELYTLADKALDSSYPFSGVVLFEINTKSSQESSLKGLGVLDISTSSNAYLEGLRFQDVITHINDKPIAHLFNKKSFKNLPGKYFKVTVNRNGHTQMLALRKSYDE